MRSWKVIHRLSVMESNRESASELLGQLEADRETLAARATTPWWVPVGFGLVGAAYVAIPSFPENGTRNFVLIAAVVASVAMIVAYRRATGIRASGVGARTWFLAVLTVVSLFVLISVSYGLASLDLNWWIAVPAAIAAFTVGAMSVLFTTSARERMSRAR